MKFKTILFIAVLFSPIFLKAQSINSSNTYDHMEYHGDQTLKVYAENGFVELTAYQANVIKVTYHKNNQPITNSSDRVVKKPQETYVRVTQNLDDIFFMTDSLYITINKWSFNIKFEATKHRLLTQNLGIEFADSLNSISFSLMEDEHIFNPTLIHKLLKNKIYCSKRVLKSKSLNDSSKNNLMLAFLSNKGYGLFFDSQQCCIDLCKTIKNRLTFTTSSISLNYYLIAGNNQEIKEKHQWLMMK